MSEVIRLVQQRVRHLLQNDHELRSYDATAIRTSRRIKRLYPRDSLERLAAKRLGLIR